MPVVARFLRAMTTVFSFPVTVDVPLKARKVARSLTVASPFVAARLRSKEKPHRLNPEACWIELDAVCPGWAGIPRRAIWTRLMNYWSGPRPIFSLPETPDNYRYSDPGRDC